MYADSLIVGCLAAYLVAQGVRVLVFAGGTRSSSVVALACVVVGRVLQLAEPAAAPIVVVRWSRAFRRGDHVPHLEHGVPAAAASCPACSISGRVVLVGMLSYSIYVWQFLFVAHFVPRLAGRWTHDWKWWMPCAVAVAAALLLRCGTAVSEAQDALRRRAGRRLREILPEMPVTHRYRWLAAALVVAARCSPSLIAQTAAQAVAQLPASVRTAIDSAAAEVLRGHRRAECVKKWQSVRDGRIA